MWACPTTHDGEGMQPAPAHAWSRAPSPSWGGWWLTAHCSTGFRHPRSTDRRRREAAAVCGDAHAGPALRGARTVAGRQCWSVLTRASHVIDDAVVSRDVSGRRSNHLSGRVCGGSPVPLHVAAHDNGSIKHDVVGVVEEEKVLARMRA